MVTLWPIPSEAREALDDGEHVKLDLTSGGYDASVVIAFEEHVDDEYEVCEWEVDDGWT